MSDFLCSKNDKLSEVIEKKMMSSVVSTEKWDRVSKEFNPITLDDKMFLNLEGNLYKLSQKADIKTIRPIFRYEEKGSIIKFWVRKVVRKLIAWYIHPIIIEQNEYNNELLKVIEDLNKRIEKLEGRKQ